MMTADFERAVRHVVCDTKLDDGHGADLIAIGVERLDCLEFLEEMLTDEDETAPEFLAVLVQWSVAVGVWLERERWQAQE